MASIGQLVRAVAEVSGLEGTSVKLIGRYLREAKQIQQNSTGGAAARMSAADAASLLVAVNITELAKNAVKSVHEYGVLPLDYNAPSQIDEDFARKINKEISDCTNVLDALKHLINLHAEETGYRISVWFRRPYPQVTLRIWTAKDDDDLDAKNIVNCIFKPKTYKKQQICDRIVSVEFTHQTIRHIGKLIAA